MRVPKGSVIEVAQVEMKDYPEKAPYISIAFYYDEDGRGYTLWGGIEMDWIDKPGDILSDLDDLRLAEAKNNREVRTKVIVGLCCFRCFPGLSGLQEESGASCLFRISTRHDRVYIAVRAWSDRSENVLFKIQVEGA